MVEWARFIKMDRGTCIVPLKNPPHMADIPEVYTPDSIQWDYIQFHPASCRFLGEYFEQYPL